MSPYLSEISSVLDSSDTLKLERFLQCDQVRSDGRAIASHADITGDEDLVILDLASSLDLLDDAGEGAARRARLLHEVGDLGLVPEVRMQEGGERYSVVRLLVVQADDADDSFAGDEEDG